MKRRCNKSAKFFMENLSLHKRIEFCSNLRGNECICVYMRVCVRVCVCVCVCVCVKLNAGMAPLNLVVFLQSLFTLNCSKCT